MGALLVRNGAVLLGKRAPTRQLAPDVWDVFGGHVEPGETAEAALARELREELGIYAKQVNLLEVLDDPQLPDGAFPLFVVDEWVGVPFNNSPEEHTEIRWFSLDQIERLPLAHPAYVSLIARVWGNKQVG
ncbi:MAG TPA: NUDIX domain-containing protein [bacterium]|nr:NUDIX domain-containing protein [bacterium]